METPREKMLSLLYKVRDQDVLHYIEEAFVCFEAGAYRACIVMTVNAVFEDLLRKTRKLASVVAGGDIIVMEIEKIVLAQKAFEQTLVERLAGSDIIKTAQSQRLQQLIDHRNKAAHPSGIDASPEEAQFVFVEAITQFLQHRGMSGYDAASDLFTRLPGENFFPDDSPRTLEDIVHSEIVHLDPRAINSIAGRLEKALVAKKPPGIARNARLLLRGLCYQGDINILEALAKHVIVNNVADPQFVKALYDIFAIDARILEAFETSDLQRLDAGIADVFRSLPLDTPRGSTYHPFDLLESVLRRRLPDEMITHGLAKTMKVLVQRFVPDFSTLLELLDMPIQPETREMLFAASIARIDGGSGTEAANIGARSVVANIDRLERLLFENEAIRLVISLTDSRAIERDLAAEIRRDGYALLQPLLPKAARGLELEYDSAGRLLERVGDTELRNLLSREAAE